MARRSKAGVIREVEEDVEDVVQEDIGVQPRGRNGW